MKRAAFSIVVIFATFAVFVSIGPDTTTATIDELCQPGYARAHRPPEAYTWVMKRALIMAEVTRSNSRDPRDFELDHIIPICLGGSGWHVSNLQLQPWAEAKEKDQDEASACRLMCSDEYDDWGIKETFDLKAAQNAFRNWSPRL